MNAAKIFVSSGLLFISSLKTEKLSFSIKLLMLSLGAHIENTGLNPVFVVFQFKSASHDK